MLEQASLALLPRAGTQWLEQALPDERTVMALAGLNRDFLGLVGNQAAASPGQPALGLPAQLAGGAARAAALNGVKLRLPFALFDLRFRDGRYWSAQASAAAAVRDGPAAATLDPRVLQFTREVLIFAWHTVQRDAAAARLTLGLDDGTESVLSDLPVGALEGVARRSAPVLAARFCSRERFWELLLGDGQSATPQRLTRMRLLGQQLQGMEAARARLLHRRARRSIQA